MQRIWQSLTCQAQIRISKPSTTQTKNAHLHFHYSEVQAGGAEADGHLQPYNDQPGLLETLSKHMNKQTKPKPKSLFTYNLQEKQK